jgi:indole-3-glycerol phosphate synthase
MGVIDRILEKRRERIGQAMAARPLADLRREAESAEPPRDFQAAITRPDGGRIRLIAELKKASPSRGLIRPEFDPEAIAREYDGLSDAISVLTEEDFFQGELSFIRRVKAASARPALRKDFIVTEYQIHEARAAGADALLLMAIALDPAQAAEYLAIARGYGMGVLFEVHDHRELEVALKMDAPVIGINNRDFLTLKTDLATTFALLREVPEGHVTVSESGIHTRDDVERVAEAGAHAMLVGTSIMQSPDIGAKVRELLPEAGR